MVEKAFDYVLNLNTQDKMWLTKHLEEEIAKDVIARNFSTY